MFYNKFNKDKHSIVKIGTMLTRYRDCASLQELLYLHKSTGLAPSALARWVWTKAIADDLDRICYPGNEVDKFDSYMPYFMSMSLAAKSPYSAVLNADFHMWVHTIMATWKNKRSMNARMVGVVNLSNTVLTASVFAYALYRTLDIGTQYDEDGGVSHYQEVAAQRALEEEEVTEEEPATEAENAVIQLLIPKALPEPEGLKGDLWLAYIKDKGCRVTDPMMKYIGSAWRDFKQPREGSVASYLLSMANSADSFLNPPEV